MGESTKNLKRNLLYNTAGNIIYFICQWLITGLFVKTMSPDGEGVFNAGILATALTASNMFLTFSQFGMRNFQVSDNGSYPDITYIRSRYLTSAASVVFCLIYSLIIGYRGVQLAAVMIWLMYKLVESVTDVYHGCCQKRGRMDVIGVSYALRGLLTVSVFVVALRLTESLIFSIISITVVSYLFAVYVDIYRNRSLFSTEDTGAGYADVRKLLIECIPLAAYAFLSTASASVPKTVLERLCGTEAIGIFNLVNSPVMILQVGIAYLFTPFIGVFAEKLQAGDRKGFVSLAVRLTIGVGVICILGICGVFLIGKWGLGFLYGEEMKAYSYLLIPMVVTTAFTGISLFYCMLLTVMRNIRGLIISNVIGILTSLIISLILIRKYTLIGTSFAAIIALIVQCFFLACFGLKKLNRE